MYLRRHTHYYDYYGRDITRKPSKQSFRNTLTYIRPLRYAASVDLFAKLRLVVIDVVEFDGELSFWLQFLACALVDHGGPEDVKRLLFTIQASSGVQVAIILVDDKDGAGPLTREDVLDYTIAVVLV